jgi:hypothetical protein
LNLNSHNEVNNFVPEITIPSSMTSNLELEKNNYESKIKPSTRSINLNLPKNNLPSRPTAELMNKDFEIRNYQGLISKASIENELLNAGYVPINKNNN